MGTVLVLWRDREGAADFELESIGFADWEGRRNGGLLLRYPIYHLE
jgi:hypothetical protein